MYDTNSHATGRVSIVIGISGPSKYFCLSTPAPLVVLSPAQVMVRPTDPYEYLHYDMVPAHNTFKLGYENILARLDNPPFHDLTNFMGYCEAWAVSIAGHHDSEEEVVFPVLNTKLDFSREIEQHKVIHHHLDEILDIIHKAKDDHSEFDPAKLKSLMTSFKEPLYQHLDEEIEHITPDKMKVFDVQVMVKLDADLQKYVKAHGDPFLLVPYMRSHTPAELKDTWPQMQWVLRKLVIPYVLARRYSGYWKYSPYDMS